MRVSSFVLSLIFCSATVAALANSADASALIRFPAALKTTNFQVLTDQIRGGKTGAGFYINDRSALEFSGNLKLLDGAGFARIVMKNIDGSAFKLPASQHLKLELIGDGRTYRMTFRDKANVTSRSEVSFEQSFATTGSKQRVDIDLSSLSAVRRGKSIKGPKLDLAQVTEIGFELADKIEKPFGLEVETIENGN